MIPVVVDASAALSWLLDTQLTPAAERFLVEQGGVDRRWRAPFVFGWEVDNTLAGLARRGRLSAQAYAEAVAQLNGYGVEEGAPFASEVVLELARDTGLSLFDAAYLRHALSLGAELVSRDRDLVAAARKAGVGVHDLAPAGAGA